MSLDQTTRPPTPLSCPGGVQITLDNVCQFTHNNRTSEVYGPAVVPVRCGETHGLHNPSETVSGKLRAWQTKTL